MVKKPQQYKKLHEEIDNIDQLQALDEAMSSIASAMETLSGYAVFADWFDTLDMVFDEMKPMYEECEAIDVVEYGKEIDDLTRDYYRSVI